MPADAQLLNCVPIFERLDEHERATLASQLDEESFEAGAHVFKQGEAGGSIFIVASGKVEISVVSTTGERIIVSEAEPGDFFGELSLFDGQPRSANAVAVEPTRALRVDRNDLRLLFSAHPDAALDVLAVIGTRLRKVDKLLGHRSSSSPNEVLEERQTRIHKIADAAAAFSGSFSFLLVHAVWFGAWLLINLGEVPHVEPFDPYPFGLLTMIVSLEAIFLSCMVLISQNRQAAKEKIRSDVEYDANIRAGLEVTQLHVKLDRLEEHALTRLAAIEKALHASPAKPAT